ncbi:MAG: type II toxin-antitoxin system VapC family toxin [Nitrospirae bacterium]|nr:type II toxin-antitoxin system VapC family toxin [Nitrospirota bacterium]
MTGVDTNIIVRLLTADDPSQSAKARALFKNHDIFISDTVMLETEWVLRYAYGFEPAAIQKAFFDLCGLPNVVLPQPHRMLNALRWFSEGMDFADALHLAASQDCRTFVTFDQKMAKRAKGLGDCSVREA